MPDTPVSYGAQPVGDVVSQMAALGELPSYTGSPTTAAPAYGTPAVTPLAPAVVPTTPPTNLQNLSWNAYKTANGYQTTDYANKQQIWNNYSTQVIPQIAQITGESAPTLQDHFQQQFAADRPVAPTRSWTQVVTDPSIAALSSAADGVKSILDAFAPGNLVSHGIDRMVATLNSNLSPEVQDANAQTAREVAQDQAQGGTGAWPLIHGLMRSPVQSVAQAAGALAPFLVGGAVGAATKAPAIASAAMSAIAGLQGAGQVRGALYDKLEQTPDSVLQKLSPGYATLRQQGVPEAAAKDQMASLARSWPEVLSAGLVNAAIARFAPVEQRLAGVTPTLSRLATVGAQTAAGAGQAGATQLATNVAEQQAIPSQSITQGVVSQTAAGAATGGILGAFAGGGAAETPTEAPSSGTQAPSTNAEAPNTGTEAPSTAPTAETPSSTIPPALTLPVNYDLSPALRQTLAEPPPAPAYTQLTSADIAPVVNDAIRSLSSGKVDEQARLTGLLNNALDRGTLDRLASREGLLGETAQKLLDLNDERTQQAATTQATSSEQATGATALPLDETIESGTNAPTTELPTGESTVGEPTDETAVVQPTAETEAGILPIDETAPESTTTLETPVTGEATGDGLSEEAIRSALNSDTLNHNVDVYPTLNDAPDYIRQQATTEHANDIEGFFDSNTGRVGLIASNISSPERAQEIARHELVGHYGLEDMVGTSALNTLTKKVIAAEQAGNALFRQIGQEVDQKQPGLAPQDRAKEIIATMAERNLHNSITHQAFNKVRQFVKRIGLTKNDISDAEIAGLLRDTEQYLEQQGRAPLAQGEPESKKVLFSRSGASSIPLFERNPSLMDRVKGVVENPAVAREMARTLLSEGGSAPQPKWLEDGVTAVFDYRNPLVQILRRSGMNEQGQQFLYRMRTFEAATETQIHNLETQRVDPMREVLQNAWLNMFSKMPWYQKYGWEQFIEDIGTVGNLIKHGPERNADIARKTEGEKLNGSGRTNEEIAQYEADIRRDAPGLIEFYEGLYNDHIKPMLDYRDQVLRESGLLTPEMEAGRPNYQWYVPLVGDPNEVEDNLASTYGRTGKSLKSPKDKRAMGREGTLANNAIQNILETTETAIRRAGMQGFKKDFVDWVKSNETAKNLLRAKINDIDTKEIFEKYISSSDGLVHQRVKPSAAISPEALVWRNGDQTTVIHIGNEKALAALQATNRGEVNGIFALPMRATRLFSGILTRYNPTFPLMNKIKDVQSHIAYVLADAPIEDKLGATRRILANNAKFITQWKDTPDSEFHQWRKRFHELGGITTYTDLFHDNVLQNFKTEFAKGISANTYYKYRRFADNFGDFLDRIHEHVEVGSRVALFKGLVDSGMSERDAATYAKGVLNYEVKGRLGRQLGALYAFVGPALHDSRRILQSIRTPRGAAVMAAHIIMMYGLQGALKAMGGKDPDGIDRWDKVPLTQTGRFLTLLDPTDPDGKGWKFPVGFGYMRIANTIAAAIHRFADGVDDGGTFASNILQEGLLANLSPLDPTDVSPSKDLVGWLLQEFTPSIVKPLVQLGMNQTGQGNYIHMPDQWVGNKLSFQAAWPSTSLLFRGLAKDVYDKTGIDLYPETLRFLFRSYGGSAALDAINAIQDLGEKAGTSLSLSDIPMLRVFGSRSLSGDMQEFRNNSSNLDTLQKERDYARSQGTLADFDALHPHLLEAASLYNNANARMQALYQQRNKALANTDAVERQQAVLDVNRRLRTIQMMTNQAYRELQAQ